MHHGRKKQAKFDEGVWYDGNLLDLKPRDSKLYSHLAILAVTFIPSILIPIWVSLASFIAVKQKGKLHIWAFCDRINGPVPGPMSNKRNRKTRERPKKEKVGN